VWVNPFFDETHHASSLDLVRANPLATVVVGDPVRIAHVPVLLEERADGTLELVGHMPRVDPASAGLEAGQETVVVFHGARSYVSPAWYTAPGLPTYNYLVAHLVGVPCVMSDPEELRAHLLDLISVQEAQHALDGPGWTPNEIAHARMDQLMPLILGFRIAVTDFQIKAKLGQNRSVEDQRSVSTVLSASHASDDQTIAQHMAVSINERSHRAD
jgi:transcriptional regulator